MTVHTGETLMKQVESAWNMTVHTGETVMKKVESAWNMTVSTGETLMKQHEISNETFLFHDHEAP